MPPESTVTSAALKRLPGRSPTLRLSRAEANARLWLDGDQLVQETVRSYTQEIQRFALADVQAVQIRRTVRGLVYNLVLGAVLALPLYGLVESFDAKRKSLGDWLPLAIVCGLLTVLLIFNVLRGPTCRAMLLTALGPQRLLSLSRLRPARRALDQIAAGAEAVQGAVRTEDVAQQLDRK